MSKIFRAVRFDFGIFRWIFVHFFVSFHFIRFDLYCYKIAPRSFQLPAYLCRTLLDLERRGVGKRQSRAELCNQVIGIHTFFIWPYLSCTQINRAIESLRHVIRIWTPFLAVPFFSFFWLLCRCCVFICPFFGCFYPAHFPTTAYTFCSQTTHIHSHTHTFTYASSSFRCWLERAFRSIIMENLHHNNGFSIRRAIFLLSSKGQQTENITHDYHSHWNSIWNIWTHGTKKTVCFDYHFQFCGFLLKDEGLPSLFFCLHRLNLYVIVCQRIFSKTMICFLELWALAS